MKICFLITNQVVTALNMLSELLIDPFQYDFMIRALIAAVFCGATLSTLGTFTINRNMGFMADAMAHATLPVSYTHLTLPTSHNV